MALSDSAAWQIEVVRLTVFAGAMKVDAKGKDWWRQVTSIEPQQASVRNQVEYSESGPYKSGTLELKTTFNRIDWVLTPSPTGPGVPTLGTLSDIVPAIFGDFVAWLQSLELPVLRVGTGINVLRQMPSLVDANREIARRMNGAQIDVDAVQDLLFQVNYPESSRVIDGLLINRIGKWSAAVAHFMQFQAGLTAPPQIEYSYFVRGEIDVNSSPVNNSSIEAGLRSKLVEELSGFHVPIIEAA